MWKYIVVLLMAVGMMPVSSANIWEKIKGQTADIGKQTAIDTVWYAKNPSTVCRLKISNIANPYHRDLTERSLKPIILEPGRYYRGEIGNILKGAYEFEYSWEKDGRFVDSRLKTIHLFAYHDRHRKLHKKVNLTFLLRAPKPCR
jgi:hypothetical protein